jgi:uncharacterized protein
MKQQKKLRMDKALFERISSPGFVNELKKMPNEIFESVDIDGRTLLTNVVINDDFDSVSYLVQHGANVNTMDNGGWYPIHFAVQKKLMRILVFLIENGANVNAQDKFGNSPLWRAVFSSMGDGDIIKVLLDNGADPDMNNFHEMSPRNLAETIANYNVLQFFPK